jgi:hypothetical protein
MPVEIKKLIVKAIVDSSGSKQGDDTNSSSSKTPIDQEQIIKNCVKQVLQILKQTKQR